MSKFSQYFPDGLLPGMMVPYAHKNEWAVHEVLPFVFSEIGPFHLSLATFNISEDALRPLFFMQDRGELLSCRFLFDNMVKRHKLDIMFFSGSIADMVRSSASHMKVLLCHNDVGCLSVVGSANMNRNPRHEAGFFSTDRAVYDFYLDYYNKVFNNDSEVFYGID